LREKITVEISPTGETKVSVTGVRGKRCLQLTEELEKELGQMTESKLTGEYYEQPLNVNVKH
jgi:hypothetical protein